jgi:hypothetical protein
MLGSPPRDALIKINLGLCHLPVSERLGARCGSLLLRRLGFSPITPCQANGLRGYNWLMTCGRFEFDSVDVGLRVEVSHFHHNARRLIPSGSSGPSWWAMYGRHCPSAQLRRAQNILFARSCSSTYLMPGNSNAPAKRSPNVLPRRRPSSGRMAQHSQQSTDSARSATARRHTRREPVFTLPETLSRTDLRHRSRSG